jgi:serine/threonine protein kinase
MCRSTFPCIVPDDFLSSNFRVWTDACRQEGKAGRGLDEVEARSIMRMLLDGIKYLHAQHIVHRDLKLSNLLLTADMQVRKGFFMCGIHHSMYTWVLAYMQNTCSRSKYLISECLPRSRMSMAKAEPSAGHPITCLRKLSQKCRMGSRQIVSVYAVCMYVCMHVYLQVRSTVCSSYVHMDAYACMWYVPTQIRPRTLRLCV